MTNIWKFLSLSILAKKREKAKEAADWPSGEQMNMGLHHGPKQPSEEEQGQFEPKGREMEDGQLLDFLDSTGQGDTGIRLQTCIICQEKGRLA